MADLGVAFVDDMIDNTQDQMQVSNPRQLALINSCDNLNEKEEKKNNPTKKFKIGIW